MERRENNMSIEKVRELMQEVGWGFLATTDGKNVGCRPMGGWAWFDDELWCASGKDSDKIRQLEKVQHAEYCFCGKDGGHVRIAGSCAVSEKIEDKLKLYESNPCIGEHIKEPADPNYVVIRMKPDKIRLADSTAMEYEEIST